ncbi:MAG: hypothetical protein NZ473_07820 [Candidatus Kapabacteria bacterium]|nr:hypothetical protein [Candidatus Kapabacteria bacterium]MDW7996597.1 hypothetical protein [Bacteroidota bacterium]MDW8225714.1 hypothetical protein [Bacteroidota bacterium]
MRIVTGFGMKEASHFLRNTGAGGIAVIDRHIVRWLQRLGYPALLPQRNRDYEQWEAVFIHLAQMLGIPVEALDLLCWSLETGEILR